jgi:hypothetical protein
MDLRKHLPGIVPQAYLRNAISGRPSPDPLKIKDLNKLSHLEVAKVIRSLVKYFTPDVELNYQSYEYLQGGKEFGMAPKAPGFSLSSLSRFGFPQIDFGGKTESFEAFVRSRKEFNNRGNVWLEDEGARISFWMSKRKWNKGIWKSIEQSGD